jgi:hypothetical protein
MLEAARVSQVGVPVIDIEGLSSPRSSDRQAVDAGLRAAYLHDGFFYISNHGIAEALVADVFSEAAASSICRLQEDRSVHLPLQRKMQEMSPCRAVYGLDSDHTPQLSDPDALVALFMTAVAEHARTL